MYVHKHRPRALTSEREWRVFGVCVSVFRRRAVVGASFLSERRSR